MRRALLVALLGLAGCSETTAPEPATLYHGGRCAYTDTVVTPYADVVMIGVINDPARCRELAAAYPLNVTDRR